MTRIGQYTPLHLAAKAGSTAVAKALLKAGADVNAKTHQQRRHGGAPGGARPAAPNVINLLADAKADVNATENEAGHRRR